MENVNVLLQFAILTEHDNHRRLIEKVNYLPKDGIHLCFAFLFRVDAVLFLLQYGVIAESFGNVLLEKLMITSNGALFEAKLNNGNLNGKVALVDLG